MKKIYKLAFVIVMCFMLVGCGNDEAQPVGEVVDTDVRLFRQLMNRDEKVIVYIGNTGCPACRNVFPIIEQLAGEHEINFYYVNLSTWSRNDMDNVLARYINFRYTPTFVIMDEGEQVDTLVGGNYERVTQLLQNNGIIEAEEADETYELGES